MSDFKTIPIDFPGNQYVREETEKKTFVLHHSAGWDNARGMFDTWARDTQGRVATSIGITDDGTRTQGFDPKYWAYAIYVQSKRNLVASRFKTKANDQFLNSQALQVEICNWGALSCVNGKYYAWPAMNKRSGSYLSERYEVHPDRVQYYPNRFRGNHYYERYTKEEIESVVEWMWENHLLHRIPLIYHSNMWDANEMALSGSPGIWTHVSYRTDKTDCHPQPELIQAIEKLCGFTDRNARRV